MAGFSSEHQRSAIGDAALCVRLPRALAADVRRVAEADCSTVSGVIRRMLKRQVEQELQQRRRESPAEAVAV